MGVETTLRLSTPKPYHIDPPVYNNKVFIHPPRRVPWKAQDMATEDPGPTTADESQQQTSGDDSTDPSEYTIPPPGQRNALAGGTVTEVTYVSQAVADAIIPLIEDVDGYEAARAQCERIVADGDTIHTYLRAAGVSADRINSIPDIFEHIHDLRVVRQDPTTGDPLVKLSVGRRSFSGVILSHGGRVTGLGISADGFRISAELPSSADLRRVDERLTDIFPDAEMVSIRRVERDSLTVTQLYATAIDQMTPRQRAVLESAHVAGYFEYPRGASGEEVAEMLGITGATFSQHLRAAQRKIFDVLFDPESTDITP